MKAFKVLLLLLVVFMIGSLAAAETTVDRISGADRYDTAAKIAQNWDEADTVLLARGDDFPDALAGTPFACQHDAPILLTPTDELNENTKAEIENLQADSAIILGGEAAVSEAVKTQVEDIGVEVERIAGANRYETARKISDELGGAEEAFIAYGDDFPDALAGVPMRPETASPYC